MPAERELRSQGRRTRAKLLEAGSEVLAQRGYHAARVDDIVRRARTSHGTFYLYFANKEDLFRALAVGCADEMRALAAGIAPITPSAAGRAELRRWVEGFVDVYRRHGPVIRAWMEDHVGDRALTALGQAAFGDIIDRLSARIAEAAPGHVRDPRLAAGAMLAMVERLTYFVTTRGVGVDDDAMLDTLAGMLHRGFFGAPAATQRRGSRSTQS